MCIILMSIIITSLGIVIYNLNNDSQVVEGSIAAGTNHIVALRNNGTVIADGDNTYGQCNVQDWNKIVFITAGYNHTVALKKDGTVVATGNNDFGECEVGEWTNVIAIVADGNTTVGLKEDSTIVIAGEQSNINSENLLIKYVNLTNDNISVITNNGDNIVLGKIFGDKMDAELFYSTQKFSSFENNSDVSIGIVEGNKLKLQSSTQNKIGKESYNNIIQYDYSLSTLVMLRETGRVKIKTFNVSDYYFNCIFWDEILEVKAGSGFVVGLTSDGTLKIEGSNDFVSFDYEEWTDIATEPLSMD